MVTFTYNINKCMHRLYGFRAVTLNQVDYIGIL